ncbi:argininosuccinate lyase [Micromonospora sp. DR5-3]|uniref:argininosuccinate lyase n=1 Tax=unclassified Micromonospora TaxID=2617518 RepID=UPI0011D48DE6|nr:MULTISPECIES: argininosuccinate lyase [unclassified Micromonospora]MCW3818963.1 argininosuccinate lyase [Micromonospora sp. DR5-3]TYC19651.1 argininosuccinate lyase [Micromonospora sp. MP36]
MTTMPTRLWGGRFEAAPDAALENLSRSHISYFDMAPYDLAGSRAHARELERAGLLDVNELATLLNAIDTLDDEYRRGELSPRLEDEDVHTFLERLLMERLGVLGGKLRAGRSRNDQAANDLRLYLRDKSRRLVEAAAELVEALLTQAREHRGTPAPGMTHLQPAQPITFGHQLLAHAHALSRDLERLQDWDRRSARSPLGAAALAGSAIALTPENSARELGYDRPCANSIDAVASRDHVAEFLFVGSMLAIDISRLAEEICLWATRQFRWVALDDAFATGSSIMPQKKNPDIAELARGKAGRLIGNLTGLLGTLKGLPLAYNRDLAEDKRAAFDTVETLLTVLPAMAGLVRTMRVQVAELAAQATEGFTLATEVADWLARQGVPFNEAHEITGAVVRLCEERGVDLDALGAEDLASVDPRLTPDVRAVLMVEAALAARSGTGGTAPERVEDQIVELEQTLADQRSWAATYAGPRA